LEKPAVEFLDSLIGIVDRFKLQATDQCIGAFEDKGTIEKIELLKWGDGWNARSAVGQWIGEIEQTKQVVEFTSADLAVDRPSGSPDFGEVFGRPTDLVIQFAGCFKDTVAPSFDI